MAVLAEMHDEGRERAADCSEGGDVRDEEPGAACGGASLVEDGRGCEVVSVHRVHHEERHGGADAGDPEHKRGLRVEAVRFRLLSLVHGREVGVDWRMQGHLLMRAQHGVCPEAPGEA